MLVVAVEVGSVVVVGGNVVVVVVLVDVVTEVVGVGDARLFFGFVSVDDVSLSLLDMSWIS